MRLFIHALFISVVAGIAAGAVEPDGRLYSPRVGDKVKMHRLQYTDTISGGDNAFWDLSGAKLADRRQNVTIVALTESEDSMGCVMGNTQYLYHTSGDTLFYDGFQNNLSDIIMSDGEISISPEILAGKRRHDSFAGTGRYTDRWRQAQTGSSSTWIDARGTLVTPDNDTIADVFRIKTDRRIISCHGSSIAENAAMTDSMVTIQQTSRLYAPGYRYPILYANALYSAGDGRLVSRSAYYTSLSAQEELDDAENEEVRRRLDDDRSSLVHPAVAERSTAPGIDYSLSQDKEAGRITVDFSVEQSCEVEFILAGITGIVYASRKMSARPGEPYSVTFDYGSLPYSAAYGINISIASENYSEKFYR